MTCELQSTVKASGIEWPAVQNHIPCMAHVTQLAVGAFMSGLGVICRTKSWEAHERDQQYGEHESIDNGNSQRLRKEGNAWINKVLAMCTGLAMIIEKVCISWYFESPEADLHIAEYACCINHADTWLPKWFYWLSKRHSLHCTTLDYECEDILDFYTAVAGARIPITAIHTGVASTPNIRQIPATILILGAKYDGQVYHGCIEAIAILESLYVEEAYSHIASHHHGAKYHVRSR